jgi:hypothetical protein
LECPLYIKGAVGDLGLRYVRLFREFSGPFADYPEPIRVVLVLHDPLVLESYKLLIYEEGVSRREVGYPRGIYYVHLDRRKKLYDTWFVS